jgi:8-oxo-dGTP pyrophosphatase MutT (NUDIX family)
VALPKIVHDSETLAQGAQVITACAFIHREVDGVRQVFLPKRAATKKFLPGVFELPGGHIDYGEDIVDGLKREIREELGIAISVGDPFATFRPWNDGDDVANYNVDTLADGETWTEPAKTLKDAFGEIIEAPRTTLTRQGNNYTYLPEGSVWTRYGDELVVMTPPQPRRPTPKWLVEMNAELAKELQAA